MTDDEPGGDTELEPEPSRTEGTPTKAAPAASGFPEPALDEAGCLAVDIDCRACGYNLRGLEPTGVCPECFAPIGRSIHGDLLQFSDPAWVDRMARGMKWVVTGILLGIVASISLGILLVVLLGPGGMAGLTSKSIMAMIATGSVLIVVVGAWWLTTPDPARAEADERWSLRQIARWGIVTDLISTPLQTFMDPSAGGAMPANASNPLGPVLIMLSVTPTIMVLIGYLAGLLYLRRLAIRIPNDSLARQARTVAWGYAAISALGILTVMLVAVFATGRIAPSGPGALLGVLMILGCIFAGGGLMFTIWAIVLLFQFRSAFRRAADEARRTWARLEQAFDPVAIQAVTTEA